MVWSFCYLALRWLLQLVFLRPRSEQSKELEILVLRHELSVLRRQVRRPELMFGYPQGLRGCCALAIGYMVSRGLAKSGNDHRDRDDDR